IRGHAHLERVEAAPALVALQDVQRADVRAQPVGLDDDFGQRRGIPETEIETLAGDRMDSVRGIPGERQAWSHEIARERQAEWPCARRALHANLAELQPEALFQFMLEDKHIF